MAFFNLKRNSVTPETDNREKRAIVRYFEIVFTKFSKLVLLNLISFACALPLLCGIVTMICASFDLTKYIESIFFMELLLKVSVTVMKFSMPVALILFFASLLVYGPLTAGLTFCVRNIATGRHIWISDLFSRAKSNFKQGLALGIIDIVVVFSMFLYFTADMSAMQGGAVMMYKALKIVSVIVTLLYITIRFYTYSMAVTFELPLRDIFKNSFIFIVLGFFKNIIALFACGFILISFVSTPKIDIVLIATIVLSLVRFTAVFTTYPIIDKYMLKVSEKDDSIEE